VRSKTFWKAEISVGKMIDETGNRYGRLVALARAGKAKMDIFNGSASVTVEKKSPYVVVVYATDRQEAVDV